MPIGQTKLTEVTVRTVSPRVNTTHVLPLWKMKYCNEIKVELTYIPLPFLDSGTCITHPHFQDSSKLASCCPRSCYWPLLTSKKAQDFTGWRLCEHTYWNPCKREQKVCCTHPKSNGNNSKVIDIVDKYELRSLMTSSYTAYSRHSFFV